MKMTYWIHAIALLSLVGLHPVSTAQERSASWPTRPIRFVVPWPAGGLNDVIARTFNDRVSQRLGQSVVTDFKAGAAGRIGVAEVARARPDGYTIGMGNLGPLTIFPTLYQNTMPFNVQTDLTPITMFAASPLVLVVAADASIDSRIETAGELMAAYRAQPDAYNFGSVGLGSPAHLMFEIVLGRAAASAVHVPYKSTAEVLQALLSRDIHSAFDTLPLLLPQIRAGRVRALAVSTVARVPQLPDVPTLGELGLSDVDVLTWYALIAPTGTPQPIVDRLYQAYTEVAQLPEVQRFLAEQGLVYVANTQAQFAARIAAETRRWARVIAEKQIQVE